MTSKANTSSTMFSNQLDPSQQTTNFLTWGMGIALSVFLGGQIVYSLYRLKHKTQKIQAKKSALDSHKKRLEDMERQRYEETISELKAQVEKYKAKYQNAKERLKNQGVPRGQDSMSKQIEELKKHIADSLKLQINTISTDLT